MDPTTYSSSNNSSTTNNKSNNINESSSSSSTMTSKSCKAITFITLVLVLVYTEFSWFPTGLFDNVGNNNNNGGGDDYNNNNIGTTTSITSDNNNNNNKNQNERIRNNNNNNSIGGGDQQQQSKQKQQKQQQQPQQQTPPSSPLLVDNDDDDDDDDDDDSIVVDNDDDDDDDDNASPAPKLKVPYPIFVASLYKSGTTSAHSYFVCGKQKAIHHNVDVSGPPFTGKCFMDNVDKGIPIFQGCPGGGDDDDYDVFSDNAHVPKCYDPSTHSMDAIYKDYPNATIMLTVRDPDKWLDSVDRYRFGTWALLPVLQNCTNLWPEQPVDHYPLTRNDIRNFYVWQIQHVREYVQNHPSFTYIEINLDDEDTIKTGKYLEERIGISSTCWGNMNHNIGTKDGLYKKGTGRRRRR